MIDGPNLKFIAEVRSRKDVWWDSHIEEQVKERYNLLIE